MDKVFFRGPLPPFPPAPYQLHAEYGVAFERVGGIAGMTQGISSWSDVLVHVTDCMGINCMAQPTTVSVCQPLINNTPITTYIESGLDVCYRVYPSSLNPFGSEIDYCQYLGSGNEYTTQAALLVYPNPGNGNVNLEYNSLSASDGEIMITSVAGQKVYDYKWPLAAGINRKKINIGQLNAGMYFIILIDGNRCYTKKIVVEK